MGGVSKVVKKVVGGIGKAVGGLFGMSTKAPKVETVEVEEAPREAEQEAESAAIRDEEQRKIRRRRQLGGTILTSPLGATGSVESLSSSLLGQSGLR